MKLPDMFCPACGKKMRWKTSVDDMRGCVGCKECSYVELFDNAELLRYAFREDMRGLKDTLRMIEEGKK